MAPRITWHICASELEIVVSDGMADQVVETIQKTAKTDKIGDSKIFVLDVESAVRVRTGETNDDAVRSRALSTKRIS